MGRRKGGPRRGVERRRLGREREEREERGREGKRGGEKEKGREGRGWPALRHLPPPTRSSFRLCARTIGQMLFNRYDLNLVLNKYIFGARRISNGMVFQSLGP